MRIILVLLLTFSAIQAQQGSRLLNSLIANEYAFSSKAGQVGSRDAFLEFISDDAILFRPDPVNGKKYLNDSKPSKGFLFWYPTDAFVARSGDLGYTTGPWEWSHSKTDSQAVAFGNFCTVWQKQPDNKWKFLIDIGNWNEKPSTPAVPLKYDETDTASTRGLIRGMKREKTDELIKLDDDFTSVASRTGIVPTFQKFISESTKIIRDGVAPVIGEWAIIDFLSQRGLKYKYTPLGGKISSSRDFGYTYGELYVTKDDPKVNDQYNYLRIWQKEGRHWTIKIEVNNKVEKK